MEESYDVIVIGGGAAGLTAGIYLARARMKTLIVDHGSIGGQMVLTHSVANYPGVPEASGAELVQVMRRQAESFGCRVLGHADILSMELHAAQKRIEVDDEGVFTAPAVIVATGGLSRTLGLESESRLRGRGISYCATCDGDFFTDQDIAVIGGGNSALEEAVSLTKYASSVTIIHEFDHFQAQPWAVEEAKKNEKIRFLMNQRVLDFEGEDNVQAVLSVDKSSGEQHRTPVTGAFIFIGYVPNTKHFEGLLELSPRMEIVADEEMRTSLAGVFAAGDARTKRYRQITTAVADGTIAALSAIDYVNGQRLVA
ncbi:MAG: FAD-dependent oxidoreductase [Myxococcota bacterium]|jgi:thioredoxin reductase (NADPH)|nr:FAD-dependent oxidoreductase [Myxococcota bacterium]